MVVEILGDILVKRLRGKGYERLDAFHEQPEDVVPISMAAANINDENVVSYLWICKILIY